jgi:transcriptional regulator with XRE-family HTH domain
MDETMENKEISTKIRRYRESKDFTQEYMASQLGMTQNSYSRIEKEPESVPLKRLEEICKILEINLKDLLESKESNVYYNNQDTESQYAYGNIIIHNYPKELMDNVLSRLENIENSLRK